VQADEPPLHLHADRQAEAVPADVASLRVRSAVERLPQPATLRPLVEDADGLIRALFACGFTSAAVQGRLDVGADLSEQLTALIDTLDEAIRGIRHALSVHDAA
jgi:hypothetical protein